ARYPACLATLQLIARLDANGAAEPIARERGFDALEQLEDSDPVFRRTNLATAAILQRLCDMTPATRILRIREIAAQSRPLGAALLSALPAERVEYEFIGDDTPAAGHYDIVVASVFDAGEAACADLAAAENALKPGGLLLLLAPNVGGFRDLIHTALTGSTPSRETDWLQLLNEAGFADALALGQSDPVAARALYLACKPASVLSMQRSSYIGP